MEFVLPLFDERTGEVPIHFPSGDLVGQRLDKRRVDGKHRIARMAGSAGNISSSAIDFGCTQANLGGLSRDLA